MAWGRGLSNAVRVDRWCFFITQWHLWIFMSDPFINPQLIFSSKFWTLWRLQSDVRNILQSGLTQYCFDNKLLVKKCLFVFLYRYGLMIYNPSQPINIILYMCTSSIRTWEWFPFHGNNKTLFYFEMLQMNLYSFSLYQNIQIVPIQSF
jgi:hypothetical protein